LALLVDDVHMPRTNGCRSGYTILLRIWIAVPPCRNATYCSDAKQNSRPSALAARQACIRLPGGTLRRMNRRSGCGDTGSCDRSASRSRPSSSWRTTSGSIDSRRGDVTRRSPTRSRTSRSSGGKAFVNASSTSPVISRADNI
jgi:hypothetical protein